MLPVMPDLPPFGPL